jgi:hypothetical protein
VRPASTMRAQRRAASLSQLRRAPAAEARAVRKVSSVQVHIGELALNGFAPGSERRIAAAFEQELGSLLARQLPPGWGTALSVESVTARVRVRSQRDPVAIGEQLAAAVFSAHREDHR